MPPLELLLRLRDALNLAIYLLPTDTLNQFFSLSPPPAKPVRQAGVSLLLKKARTPYNEQMPPHRYTALCIL